jgi:hypothetical protein
MRGLLFLRLCRQRADNLARSSRLALTCVDAALVRPHPHVKDSQPTRRRLHTQLHRAFRGYAGRVCPGPRARPDLICLPRAGPAAARPQPGRSIRPSARSQVPHPSRQVRRHQYSLMSSIIRKFSWLIRLSRRKRAAGVARIDRESPINRQNETSGTGAQHETRHHAHPAAPDPDGPSRLRH